MAESENITTSGDESQSTGSEFVRPPRDPNAQRYKLTIAYDGSGFHGWQKQEPPGEEPLRTVAAVVERGLAELVQQPVTLVGASRTDAGVHARGQVAHFDAVNMRVPVRRLPQALTSRLPDDVDIIAAEEVLPTFDAISGAKHKQYRYRMFTSTRRPLWHRDAVYHCFTPLDVNRMNAAARRLVGTHDFEGFAAAGHGRVTTVRTIFDCKVIQREGVEGEPEVHIFVEGDGFLYNMVRIIAGTLVEVGRGHFEPTRIDEIIAATDRRLAGPTLPAAGLCLEWIRYD